MSPLGPQLANPLKGSPAKGSVFEPKYDGIRLVVVKEGDNLQVYTRTFKDQLGKLPHLEAAFRSIPFDFTLDGEAVAVESTSTIQGQEVPVSNFSKAQSVMGSGVGRAANSKRLLSFIAFDCLAAQGKNLCDVPDVLRRGALELIVDQLRVHTEHVLLSPRWTQVDDYEALMAEVVEAGGEGLMVKNPLARYYPGKRPNNAWSKLKDVETADVVIICYFCAEGLKHSTCGFKPGEGKYKGQIGAIDFGQYVGGRLTPRSRCSGMSDAERRWFTDNQSDALGRVMEIKFFGRVGPERSFRHPNFVTLRDDKTGQECGWDE